MPHFNLRDSLKVKDTEDGEQIEIDLSLKNIFEVPDLLRLLVEEEEDFRNLEKADLSLENFDEVLEQRLAANPKLTEATALNLSHNWISYIPRNICRLTHLVRINLAYNELTALPEQFGCLVHLEILNLRANHLTTLPKSFGHLRSLTWLNLASNPLNPTLMEQAGDCQDDYECVVCAKSVVAAYKGMDETNERNGSQQMSVALKASSITVVALALIVGTVVIGGGGGNLKDRLFTGAVATCTHVCNGAVLSTRQAGHLWHSFTGIFRPGQESLGKVSGEL